MYLCMYVRMYVCMYLSMYWVMSHQSDWGYYTALESGPPMKWPVQTVLRFLKVNQGDIGLGHLENTASWKHLDNFSTLSRQKSVLHFVHFFFFELLIFSSECKASYSSLHAQVFWEDNLWWCGLVMRLFYVTDFVYEFCKFLSWERNDYDL